MNVRDATADDADALGALADGDVDAGRLVRDRAVRVAETGGEVVGFVAFDTWRDTVHLTRLDGEPEAVRVLLDAPCAFAAEERLPVEVVLPESDDARDVVADAGFEDVGPGPTFDGEATRRYRRMP